MRKVDSNVEEVTQNPNGASLSNIAIRKRIARMFAIGSGGVTIARMECKSCERRQHYSKLRRCAECDSPICVACGNYRGESGDEPGDEYLCDDCECRRFDDGE